MARLSVVVLNLDGDNAPALDSVAAAAESADMAFSHVSGNFDEVLKQVESWTILPEIIVIDTPRDMPAEEAVAKAAERFPEGEAEVLLYNVPNDIGVYRSLKHKGVREIFSGTPSVEEMSEALDEIGKANLRRSGIDPRKMVYVWSTCGGAGGTSLAIAMARKLSREGRRTLFIDLDLSTSPASFMFNSDRGARETMGLVEALANPGRIDALFLERAIDVADKNLFYLSARKRQNDPAPLSAALPVLIARAQQNFDIVVMDVPWRATPLPEMSSVQGHSYVVTPPTPAGLLGFSMIMKDLENAPGKSPVYAVLNREGEFKSNDIMRTTFKSAGDVEFFAIPYDAGAAGRMFYEQKSYLDLGGKIKKPLGRILATLPSKVTQAQGAISSLPPSRRPTKKRKGFLRR